MEYYDYYDSPIGTMMIAEEEGRLTHLTRISEGTADTVLSGRPAGQNCTPIIASAKKQLDEYFGEKRRRFDLPLNPKGTDFQKKVWEALCSIPYGQTRSYKEIALQVDNPKGCRAVGMANHRNPIMIVIPCHRVVGSNGTLTGYAGGLDIKEWLLDLEGARKITNTD